MIAFARGVPGPDLLPIDAVQRAATRVLDEHPTAALSYTPPSGYAPLRETIAGWHDVDPDRILLTNGSLQGFALIIQSLLARDGVEVIVERPSYDRPLDLLHRLGVASTSIDLDDEGLDPEQLPDVATGSGDLLAYAIPTFHNPAGTTMPMERRSGLAAWAANPGRWLFEDDPYRLLWFDDEPPPTVFELAGGSRVIHASSFSKTIAPGVRTGYLVLPEELIKPVSGLAASSYICPTTLSLAIVSEILDGGDFPSLLAAARSALAERCAALCGALDELIPDGRYVRPTGGYFVWLELPTGTTATTLAPAAEAAGVSFVAGGDFGPDLDGYVRLAFSAHTPAEIRTGVDRLAGAIDAVRQVTA